MKQPQLRARELANTADLSRAEKAVRFDKILQKNSGGAWSYDVLEVPFLSALGKQEAFADVLKLDSPSLRELEESIDRKSYKRDQAKACKEILRIIHPWAKENITNSTEFHINAAKLGVLGPYKYCLNLVIEVDEKKTIICPEFRRQGQYTKMGRKFIMSLVKRIAVASNAELFDSSVEVFRFYKPANSERYLKRVREDDFQEGLYSVEQLTQMIEDTAIEWQLACNRYYGGDKSSGEAADLKPDDLFYGL